MYQSIVNTFPLKIFFQCAVPHNSSVTHITASLVAEFVQ
jgi:hypothetical protein